MGKLKLLLGMALICLAAQVHAQTADSLYNAKVQIADRSVATRNRVMDQALAQVITKVTGSAAYLENPTIMAAMRESDRYLQAYSYSTQQPDVTFLHARFGASSINRLLTQAKVPVWPSNRPKTLVWLVFKDYQTGTQIPLAEQVLQPEQPLTVWQQLQEAANVVGLPVILPALDPLDNTLTAQAELLWSLDSEAIAGLSRSYQPDSILVGRIAYTSAGSWRISWDYRQDQLRQVFDSSNQEFDLALRDGLAQLTRYLSGIYSVTAQRTIEEGVAVTVTEVDNFADYANVVSYLDGLAVVNRYHLQQVADSRLVVTLYLNGSYNNLTTALALDKRLRPQPSLPGESVLMRWVGD